MKDEINLLPTGVIHKRTHSVYGHRIKGFLWFLMIPLLLVNGSLIVINVSLRETLDLYAAGDIKAGVSAGDATLERVKETNNVMDTFLKKANEYESWVSLLDDAMELKPTGISILSLAVEEEKGEQTLAIRARSSSRSDVIAWQKDLESLDWVSRIEAPLQNLATSRDASFTFTLHKKE